MRIKLRIDQLNILCKALPFEVMLERPSDVRGLLDILGKEMPWDETGLSKYGRDGQRPQRVTFNVEADKESYVCDIHPALVQHIYTLLSTNKE